MNKNNKILKGAIALGLGAFVTKLLGAIYRIPLTNLLGGLGLGLYQMVFPVYSVLLDFSGAGVPSALSKIISSNQKDDKYSSAEKYLKISLKFFLVLGLFFSILMIVFSRSLSALQGNGQAYAGYVALAPAVFLVALISCYRGYFQGFMNMKPTAISQIIEQLVKLLVGLALAYLFLPNITLSVAGATLAISISEFFAFLYLFIKHKRFKKNLILNTYVDVSDYKGILKKIIKITMPITLIGIMIPLSQVIDSFLIVNILSGYRQDATALYGLLSGVASTVVGLPVSICYGISAVTIPAVSSVQTETEKNVNALRTLFLTLCVSLASAVFIACFAPFIINLLFRSLVVQEKIIAVKLLRLSSPCVVFLSLLQTSNAVLIGKGKFYKPVISLAIGVVVKVISNVTLLKITELNIYGGALSVIACYFVATLLNFIMIFSFKVKNENKSTYRREYAS